MWLVFTQLLRVTIISDSVDTARPRGRPSHVIVSPRSPILRRRDETSISDSQQTGWLRTASQERRYVSSGT